MVLIEILIDGAHGAPYPTNIFPRSYHFTERESNTNKQPTHFFPSNSASFIDQNQAYTH